jgi:hypothetical protein
MVHKVKKVVSVYFGRNSFIRLNPESVEFLRTGVNPTIFECTNTTPAPQVDKCSLKAITFSPALKTLWPTTTPAL